MVSLMGLHVHNFATTPLLPVQVKTRLKTTYGFVNVLNPRYKNQGMLFYTHETKQLTACKWFPTISQPSGQTRVQHGVNITGTASLFAALQVCLM
jgi:hypothetical protein